MDDLPPARPGSDDWPWWRGPNRDNKSSASRPPLHWGMESNILWKTAVPGRGHATPIIWGDSIFLPTADEQAQTLRVLCYDRESGQLRWNREIHQGGFMKKHEKNSHASATLACDGERLFFPAIYDDALWVSAVSLDGKIDWQKRVGSFVPSNGYGSSPLVYKSAVIVASDNVGDACLVALHRKTGQIIWRVDRPKLDNFCTPALGVVAGRPQLLLCGSRMIAGYDPDKGALRWFADTPTEVTACTMAFGDNLALGGGNVPVREFVCVRADGEGDVTGTHVLWRSNKSHAYVPSPLIHEQLLFFVNDGGIAQCLEAATGREIWTQRLGSDFSASPLLAQGKIYATNEKGQTFIFCASRQFELLATNDLGEAVFASPVICGETLFLRSESSLFCIRESDHAKSLRR